MEPEVSGRGKLTLKIETIRELQQDLNLSAYEARRKVAILTQFDAATIGAANAFLKTLEEPPNKVVLLLTATDADTLLPTISSRCRTIGLRPLPTDLIEQSLTTRWHVPADDAHLLAHLSDGRLGWAVQAGARSNHSGKPRRASGMAARSAQRQSRHPLRPGRQIEPQTRTAAGHPANLAQLVARFDRCWRKAPPATASP